MPLCMSSAYSLQTVRGHPFDLDIMWQELHQFEVNIPKIMSKGLEYIFALNEMAYS